jgi:hypothetical protein
LPATPAPATASSAPPSGQSKETLEEIEESVHSPHLNASAPMPEPPTHDEPVASISPPQDMTPPPAPAEPTAQSPQDLDAARSEVLKALSETPAPLEPLAALNSQPLGAELHPTPAAPPDMHVQIDAEGNLKPAEQPTGVLPLVPSAEPAPLPQSPADHPLPFPMANMHIPPPNSIPPTDARNVSPSSPPPVPPPLMPPAFGS